MRAAPAMDFTRAELYTLVNLHPSDRPLWLHAAKLEGVDLEGANLEGANLEGANLEVTNLIRAELRGPYALRARLRGADLSLVRLNWPRCWSLGGKAAWPIPDLDKPKRKE